MSHRSFVAAFALAASLSAFATTLGLAQEAEGPPPPRQQWSFSGPFGIYDQAQLQRIHVELIGQVVHRRFKRIEAGHGARAAHPHRRTTQ